MENLHTKSINFDYIKQYSIKFTKLVKESFFKEKKQITGKEITNLTPIQQVNLLILNKIFDAWQAQVENSKGPYFNYDHPEVNVAFKNYANLLSRHILIEGSILEDFLSQAVQDSLLILLAPEMFLEQILSENKNLTANELKVKLKYIQLHRAYFDQIIENFSKNNSYQILKPSEGFDIEQIINQFTEILQIEKAQLYLEQELIKEEIHSNLSGTINEQFIMEKHATLNEQFEQPLSNIADQFSQSKVNSIKDAITLNQRFLLINELFNGDQEDFSTCLNDIDQLNDIEKVKSYLKQNYEKKYHWNWLDNTLVEFIKTIKKKLD